jgi:hypothetical protein
MKLDENERISDTIGEEMGTDQCLALIEPALHWHERHGTALLVIDSLAPFILAHSDNSDGAKVECLTPLLRLATAGMRVLLPHHLPRIGDRDSVAHDLTATLEWIALRIQISHTRTCAQRR